MCDAALKTEYDDLRYIEKHCQNLFLRSETVANLRSHIESKAARLQKSVGRIRILPASHPGSQRNLYKHYMDAMAINTKFGAPNLLVTFTMNPAWKEMTDALRVGDYGSFEQMSHYRPDLIMRVFYAKFKVFLADILHHQAFGKVIAYYDVLEFQKRGLPHVHLALILDPLDATLDAARIDRLVCAE